MRPVVRFHVEAAIAPRELDERRGLLAGRTQHPAGWLLNDDRRVVAPVCDEYAIAIARGRRQSVGNDAASLRTKLDPEGWEEEQHEEAGGDVPAPSFRPVHDTWPAHAHDGERPTGLMTRATPATAPHPREGSGRAPPRGADPYRRIPSPSAADTPPGRSRRGSLAARHRPIREPD